LLDEAGINFLEEPGNGSGNRGANLEERLCDGIDGLNVGQSGTAKDIDVIQGAAIDVGERKERKRDVRGWIEMEVVADVVDVGTKIHVREHDALRLAGGAGRVDERSELAGKNLRSAHAVGGNVRGAGVGNKSFVTETFAGDVDATVSDDNLLEFGKVGANGEKLLQLWRANNENDLGAAMLEDIGHAVRGFVEVHRNGDGAGAVDGEIGGMPFGAIGGKKADTVTGFHAEFDESGGEAGDAVEKFLGRDGFPTAVATNHLCARVRQIIDGVHEA